MKLASDAKLNRARLLQETCHTTYHLRVGLVATMLMFFIGATIGYTSSTTRKIHTKELPFASDESDVATLSTSASWCTLLGPVLFSYSMNRFGRRLTILLLLLPIIVEFVVIFLATSTVQLIIGISIGFIPNIMAPSVISVFVSEVLAPHLRGSFSALIYAVLYFGMTVGLAVSWKCTLTQSSLFFVVISCAYFCVAWYLPETPHYLIRSKRVDRAQVVLKRLYGGNLGNLEVIRLEHHIKTAPTGRFVDIFRVSKYHRTLWLLIVISGVKYFSGFMQFMWFSPILLTRGTYHYLSPFICEMIILCCSVGFCIIVSLLYRYIPRKRLGFLSAFCMMFPLAFLAVFYQFLEHSWLGDLPDVMPFVPLLLVKLTSLLGVIPLPFMYFRELTPVQYVTYYALIFDFASPAFNAVAMFVFNLLRVHYGYGCCFLTFWLAACVGSFVYGFWVPETHKKIIENIQEEL